MDNTTRDLIGRKGVNPVSGSEYVRTVNLGFAKRFKEALVRSGLDSSTQAELALRFDISPPMINYYMKGKRLPSVETSLRICEVTGVGLDWLMLGNGTPGGSASLEELWAACSEEDRIAFLANLATRHNR